MDVGDRINGRFCSKKQKHLNRIKNTKIVNNELIPETDTEAIGNRIIDIDFFISKCVCDFCSEPIFLQNFVREIRHGAASEFVLRCLQCGEDTHVSTSKSQVIGEEKRKARQYDINHRCVLGMIDCGLGTTQMNNLLGILNIPSLNQKTITTYQDKVGQQIEKIAKQSCTAACQKEESLAINSDDNSKEVAVSYDMGWQKRGRAHNSLTGVGTIVGANTREVLDYEIMSKDCRQCKTNMNKPHNCQKNHTGSSKSMESAAAVMMFQRSKNTNLKYTTLIGDDDSTTLHHIRKSVKYDVRKWSDIQHTKRTFYGQLINIRKKNKQCTDMVVAYLRRLFSHALYQNKDKPNDMADALRAIPKHAFGDHTSCGQWCQFEQSPNTYKHKGLPRGKPLTDECLKTQLTSIFETYAKNADRLSPLASSQKNESINSVISRKAPKTMHFGGSRSLKYRVSAAVSQVNKGRTYVKEVLRKLNINTGHITNHTLNASDRKRKIDTARKQCSKFKKRRSTLKSERTSNQASNEVKEGKTYETGITMQENVEETILQIPECEFRPDLKKLERVPTDDSIIVFDLETTGLGRNADIVQIAATTLNKSNQFSQYTIPDQNISYGASKVTKLSILFDNNGNKRLDYNGAWLETVDPLTMTNNFLEWLKNITHQKRKVTLVGHNSNAFDFPVLYNHMIKYNRRTEFMSTVEGLSDTLPFFKSVYKDLGLENYKQITIAKKILQNYDETNAHNALHDVTTLAQILQASDLQDFKSTVVDLSSFCIKQDFISAHKPLLDSLKDTFKIGSTSYMSNQIATKIADSGLGFVHLKVVFERSGSDGIRVLLQEKINGKPRVTSCKRTLDKICDFLQTTFEQKNEQ